MSDFFKVNFGTEGNEQPAKEDSKEYKTKQKIERAKQDALDEIDTFEKAYNKFKNEVGDLVLYQDVFPQIEESIKVLNETVITPAVFGRPIPGMPDFIFIELRRSIFKRLMEKQKEEE